MAHEITIRENGRAEAFYAGTPAWHGLGTVVENAPNSAEAMKLAGMLWEVEQRPIYTVAEFEDIDPDGDEIIRKERIQIADKVANVRADNNVVLGVVGKGYTPVQNADSFAFVDGLVADGEIRYESAGTLKGGKITWLLARMPGQLIVGDGDATDQYILFCNSHDGSKAVRVLPTAVRVVCNNTLTLALRQSTKIFSIRHTGQIMTRLDEARKVLGLVKTDFLAYGEKAKRLVDVKMSMTQFRSYLTQVFELPKTVDELTSHQKKVIESTIYNFRNDSKQQAFGIAGTAWAGLNAVTQYVDHDMTVIRSGQKSSAQRAESRMNSALFGTGATVKNRALETAMMLA
jgi:phage/plasmid-like protein (TIGR03299 family)